MDRLPKSCEIYDLTMKFKNFKTQRHNLQCAFTSLNATTIHSSLPRTLHIFIFTRNEYSIG